MQNDLIKQWAELNKVTTDAIKELGEINTNAMTRLTQRQMEMMNLYMEGGAKQLESLDGTKDIQDIATNQSQLFEEFNTKLTENARQTASELVDVKNKLSEWAEKNTEVAAANLSKYTTNSNS
ncbi:phasin family protein [Thiotrichales bacterium HSG1]|nr:phasin family protein [Thiotrichales bacterium HSG1]